jgi:hypothetical protein
MDNLQRLIKLAKADGGKFFVIDEKANPVLVIMDIDAYEALLLGRIQGQVSDIEEINNKIAEAQRDDEAVQHQILQDQLKSEVIDSTFEFEPKSDLEGRAGLEDI